MNALLKLYDARDAMAAPLLDGRVACRKGCSACCRQPIGITKAEAIVMANGNPAIHEALFETGQLRELTDEWVSSGGDIGKWWLRKHDCVYLSDNICTVYESRPIVCRLHNSMDREPCHQEEMGHEVRIVALHHDKMFYRLAQLQWADITAEEHTREAYKEASQSYFMPAALLWAMNRMQELNDDHRVKSAWLRPAGYSA